MDHGPGNFMGNQGRWTAMLGGPLRKGTTAQSDHQRSFKLLFQIRCHFRLSLTKHFFSSFKVLVWRIKEECAGLDPTGEIHGSTQLERSLDRGTSREGK